MIITSFALTPENIKTILEKINEDQSSCLSQRSLLLLEEILGTVVKRLPGKKVVLRIWKRQEQGSVSLRIHGSFVNLFEDNMGDDDEESVQQQARIQLFLNSTDRITQRYSVVVKNNYILIHEPRIGYSNEEKIDAFYAGQHGQQPTPVEQVFFFMKLHKGAFFVSFLNRVMKSAPHIVIPIVTSNLINMVISGGSTPIWNTALLVNILSAIGSLALNVLAAWIDGMVFLGVIHEIEGELRLAMVRKLQNLSIAYHNGKQTGVLTNKIMMDVEHIQMIYSGFVGEFFQIFAYVTAAIVMTIRSSPFMTIFYLFSVPTALLVASIFRKPSGEKNRVYRLELEKTNAALSEMLDMIPLTRAHGLANNENHRMDRFLTRVKVSATRLDTMNSLFGALSFVSLQLFQIIYLVFSVWMAGRGMISAGSIALFQSYFSTIVNRVNTITNHIPQLNRGLESFRSISEILCAKDTEYSGNRKPERNFRGEIVFQNVSYRYPDSSSDVLNHLSLTIPANSSVAFVGDSGSGKSTVLGLITGLLYPREGQVLLDGIDLKELDMTAYRHHISIVPQESMLFSGTLYENLSYGVSYLTRDMVKSALRTVGLDDFVDSDDGLDSRVEEGGSNFSGGQRQRLALARALLRHPRILILDEFTSALDNQSEQKVMETVKKILGSCTVVMVSHRLDTVRMLDSIVMLQGGCVAEQGNFEELMARKGAFYELYTKTSG